MTYERPPLMLSTLLSQIDTRVVDTCVTRTQGGFQLATLRARKVLDDDESSSTEIDQPL